VLRLCEVIEVNRSSFYAWGAAAPVRAERAAGDAELAERIRVVHEADKAYGAPRVTAELNDGAPPGKRVNHKRVARVMAEHNIAGIRLRRRVRTTIPEPCEEKVPDLLKRDFTAGSPNRKYVGDITYLPLADGNNLYLATVIDCCSRKLAGWAVADHMRTELVETALKAARSPTSRPSPRSTATPVSRCSAPLPGMRPARTPTSTCWWKRLRVRRRSTSSGSSSSSSVSSDARSTWSPTSA
jgi:transposase InsO family protein